MALLAPVNWVLEALMLKDAPVAEAAKPDPVRLSWELLQRGNADATSKLLEALRDTETFSKLAADEGAMAASRDRDHKASVQAGVERSLERDTLGPVPTVAITRIDVERKSPEEVAQLILTQLPKNGTAGATVVLQGQSGTGKGTTTTTLLDKLPNSVSWSNGNVFRSLTLLAATHCKNEGIDLKENVDKVMTPENVARWMSMLRFEKIADRKYDIAINGLGVSARVSEIQNTVLKEPLVAKNIPTVAEWTQGDVVTFASSALEKMAGDGMNVILEGRAATVQYVPTPYRFELVIDDHALLGERRAAQRVMANTLASVPAEATPAAILAHASDQCQKWTQ